MLQSVDKLGLRSVLGAPLAADATSLVLTFGDGGAFAVPPAGEYQLTIRNGGEREIVKVTSQAGDVLTIQRGQSGTTPGAWGANSCVEIEPTGTNFCDAVKLCSSVTPVSIEPGPVCLNACTCLTLTADGRISRVEVDQC
jgi:hypothetical protein